MKSYQQTLKDGRVVEVYYDLANPPPSKSMVAFYDAETIKAHGEICVGCEHWDKTARDGMGQCTQGKCGSWQPWARWPKCPQGKW